MGHVGKFLTQALGQVRHGVEITHTTLVYPAVELGCSKAFFTQLFAKGG